jgi:hypothetical protein
MAEEFSAETRRRLERANETIAQSRQLATEHRKRLAGTLIGAGLTLCGIATA